MWEGIDWTRLSTQQLGRYAEHLIALDCLLYGAEVYLPEVDERGVDLVIRHFPKTEVSESQPGVAEGSPRFFEIQVKSIRTTSSDYIFFPKERFKLRATLLAGIVLFRTNAEPRRYLIPSLAWLGHRESRLLCSYDYEERASRPEWGLRASTPGRQELEDRYQLNVVLGDLLEGEPE